VGRDLTVDQVVVLGAKMTKHPHCVGYRRPKGAAATRVVERPGTADALEHHAFPFEPLRALPSLGN
jgi:hypothetical protein